MSERFGAAAARLAGQAALLLGWLPGQFWAATPEEFAAILSAAAPTGGAGMDRTTLNALMERERDARP
ncbi:phage tail assembly chaperone [Novosphingobium lentum]|uniref:phage tail assembly chaperone n=1 Tax=Novosphingobium lentum TaxID=145287 RepID=UPI0008297F8A|nr:phage tail assembly chaperone [Novosphingobium lentum]